MQDAAAPGRERPVVHAGRPAGISGCKALLAALALLVVADHQIALHHVHLLPMIVHERLGGERSRLDLQEPRAAALLAGFIEIRRQDLLEETRRIARRALPPGLQIDLDEFEMRFRLHFALLQTSSAAMA